MNKKNLHIKTVFCLITVLFIIPIASLAQGEMIKENGHYIAALDFFNNYSAETKGRITNVNPQKSSVIPNWSGSNDNIHASELIRRAILVVDWWSLFGEPTEDYNFQWVSSGYYSIIPDNKNHPVTIFRKDLVQYPDLLKRFDALKPLDIHFEIYWSLKDGIGKVGYGEGLPIMSRKSTFKTEIKNGMLFELSAKRPLSVPGIRQGKGHEFLGLSTNFNENDFKAIMSDFSSMKYDIEISSFGITYIKLPIAEMKAIAQLYDDYKSGKKEPSPLEEVADADKENADLSAYNKNDFWGEAFEEEKREIEVFSNNAVYGVKRGNTILFQKQQDYSERYSLSPIGNNGNFFIRTVNEEIGQFRIVNLRVVIFNINGEVINIDGNTEFTNYSNNSNGIVLRKLITPASILRTYKDGPYGTGSPSGYFDSYDKAREIIDKYKPADWGNEWCMGISQYISYTVDSNFNVLKKENTYSITKNRRNRMAD